MVYQPSAALVRWRLGATPRVTVVVEQTLSLSPHGTATPIATAQPVSDRIPRKARAEIVFVGSAYAKGGEAIARRKVRFSVRGPSGSLVDKTLSIVGERRINAITKAVSQPQRFVRMPITWELAFGGPGFPDNPVGVGFDAKDPRQPSILSESGARTAAGLGPRRTPALSVVSEGPLALPTAFDFSTFLTAPDDQRVDALPGREEIVLHGLHPDHDDVRCTLPDLAPRASLRAGDARLDVPLVRDTLVVDGDALTCTVVWRGDVALPASWRDDALEVDVDSARAELPPVVERSLPAHTPPRFLNETQRTITTSTVDGRFTPPPRQGDMVPIVNETPLVVATFPFQLAPPQDVLVVIVKATFDLRDDRVALAREQLPPTGDVHHDGDPNASLRYASDYAAFKPKADVLLVGSAPSGPDGNVGHVTLHLGKLERSRAVFGDRTWGASDPARFERMPLRWERALGGQLSPDNPVGIGFRTAQAVPNLQDPARLLTSPGDAPRAACFAPIAPTWRGRASKLGTYDRAWLRERWPYFPADFDPAYFNSAPREQQVDYLAGDERFALTGFGDAPIVGRLPGIRPRAFVLRTREAKGELIEALLRLDTCWFDVDARKLVLTWRGFVDVADDDAPDVSLLYVATDPVGDPAARLHAALVARSLLPLGAPADVTPHNDPDVSLREAYERLRAVPAIAAPGPGEGAIGEDATALLEAIRERRSLAGRDFRGADLAGMDLSGADLVGVVLVGAKLASANLAGADLSRADLTDADLQHADLTRAVLERARLVGARCQGARFVSAQLTGATIEGARFDEANLTDARLYDVDGAGARFDRADLRGLRANDAKLARASFVGAQGEGAVLDGCALTGASFGGAKMPRASFARCDLERADFTAADLREAVFRRARMRRATMTGANLMRATLERATLDEADLRGANLYRAETLKASLSSARLDHALLAGTKLDD